MTRHLIIAFVFIVIALSAYQREGLIFAPIAIAAGYIAAVFVQRRNERQRERFINQLKSQRNELRNGGAVIVDGMVLRYHSLVTSFSLSLGFLFTNIVVLSRWKQCERNEHRAEAFAYSIGSLIFGWWSLPTGPLLTLGCLQSNLRGGTVSTVATLIDARLFELARRAQERDVQLREFYFEQQQAPSSTVEPPPRALPDLGPNYSEQQLLRHVSQRPEYGLPGQHTRSARDLQRDTSPTARVLNWLKETRNAAGQRNKAL